MRTLKFKAQLINAFLATVNQMFGGSSQLPTMSSELCSTIWFDYRALGSSRKLGGVADTFD